MSDSATETSERTSSNFCFLARASFSLGFKKYSPDASCMSSCKEVHQPSAQVVANTSLTHLAWLLRRREWRVHLLLRLELFLRTGIP
jgi:hypothetical protein